MDNTYILIMAGGEGTRFYPLSTPERPKQFVDFFGGRTVLQHTYDRIKDLVSVENVFIATNERYINLVESQLPEIPSDNIIGETAKKNTGPCIAYASKIIAKRDPDAMMLILPSDHIIKDEAQFREVVEKAINIANEREILVTLGIKPNWAADCYGYIKMGRLVEDDSAARWNVYTVDSFIEKPSIEIAQRFIDDGTYVWNSGMFIWKASLILSEIKKHLPEMSMLLKKYDGDISVRKFFNEVESISIDYGIMERSKRVATIPCDIGWSDIGTWQSLYNLAKSELITLEPNIERVMKEQLGL